MPQESRPLTGGIDTDSSLFAIQQGDVLNSVNLRNLLQRGQSAGTREWIAGNSENTNITALLPAGTNTLLGKCVDDSTGKLYLFVHNSNGTHRILELDTESGVAVVKFSDALVTGGLDWDSDMFISCDVADGLLLWCQGNTDQRYINLNNTYSSPITQAQLTLASEPGMVPPTQTRVDVAGGTPTIQFTPLQFCYRFINEDGVTSVLSPYSTTALPMRVSQIQMSVDAGNAVTVTIPVTQKIPDNWKRVELVARFVETNVFFVIKRWQEGVTADDSAVALHNAATSPLTLTQWAGETLETIDAATAAKQFDLAPIEPQEQILAANRNLLANFLEGYDTPTTVPTITRTPNTFTPNTPTSTAYQVYAITIKQDVTDYWYFALILRISSVNYLLPKECSTGKFVENASVLLSNQRSVPGGIFNVPEKISLENLIRLNEQGDPDVATIGTASPTTATEAVRLNIVREANSLVGVNPADGGSATNFLLAEVKDIFGVNLTVDVEVAINTPNYEYGPLAEQRAFLPVLYQYGVQYFDTLARKSGVANAGSFTPAVYDISAPSFTEKQEFTMPSGTQLDIPEWAAHYALTITKATRAQRFTMFFGGIVKALFKTGTGDIVYGDKESLTTVPGGYTIYGIGVPIPRNYPYEYVAGDIMQWSVGSENGTANILGVHNGMFVLEYTDSISMDDLCDGYQTSITVSQTVFTYNSTGTDPQPKTSFILYSGLTTTSEQYEVGNAFGPITNAGTSTRAFGNFYSTGNLTTEISGDAHTFVRPSNAGGGTGLSMTPREKVNSVVWVNDLGRSAPTDSVGQKRLVNAVRWSNARIPGAVINGYGSFDANDFKTVDITAGDITAMALTTRGTQDGGQLLVLCTHGSFAALIGQQQIAGADGKNAFTASATVIGEFNALRGQWGCQSPRSVVDFEGKVWWVDAYKRALIEFNESGAGNVGLFKTARLWDSLLALVTNPALISCGVDSFTGNLLVSIPEVAVTPASLPGFAGTQDTSDAVDGSVRTWLYDYNANRCVGGYTSGAEFVRVGPKVYGFKEGKLWDEFTVGAGSYYGQAEDAVLAVVFNAEHPAIKRPVTLKLSGTTAPTTTILKAGTGTATIQPYKDKEGVKHATVMRDRTGNGASTLAAWAVQSVNGRNLKGGTIVVMFRWTNGDDAIALENATLVYDLSAGY